MKTKNSNLMFIIELIGKPLFKVDQHNHILIYQCYVKVTNQAVIVRRYGVIDGKLQINESDPIEGKNIDKSNETTSIQQAKAEALSLWTAKKQEGYVSFGAMTELFGKNDYAANGELPPVPIIGKEFYNSLYQSLLPYRNKGQLGRYLPMLAQDVFKGGKEDYNLETKRVKRTLKGRLDFPVAVQAKFDGFRCIVDCRNIDKPTLMSRQGTDWTAIHWRITNKLKEALKEEKLKPLIYDCEIYGDAHFQDLVSLIKAPDESPMFADSLYLVCYDIVDTEKSFKGRFLIEVHNTLLKTLNSLKDSDVAAREYLSFFKIATTYIAENLSQVNKLHDKFVALGYEGAMIRILNSQYEPDKRSKGLLKYKVFDCDEFDILGIEERKKEVVFKLYSPTGGPFYCTPPGTKEENANVRNNPNNYIGKMLTVKYFGLTKDGLPRMPKGIAIRDYE